MLNCINGTAPKGTGPVIIIGSGRSVWDDLAAVPYPTAPCIGVNTAGVFCPRMLHWVSMHRELFAPLIPAREYHWPKETTYTTHAWRHNAAGVQCVWDGSPVPDTSGCLGLMLALQWGYSPVILCGITLSDSGRFHDPYSVGRVEAYRPVNDTWAWLRKQYGSHIRSMSGLTRQWFGTA